MKNEHQVTTVYTIIHAAANTEDGCFAASRARGSFLSLTAARQELEKQIAVEKRMVPSDYDCEEQTEDRWMVYQDGLAAAAYSKLEIVPTTIDLRRTA